MALAFPFLDQCRSRLDRLAAEADAGALDPAIDLLVGALDAGGVLRAFGTGHSQAFVMELAGRAGGLIPAGGIALRDVVLHGSRSVEELAGSTLERDPSVVDELFEITPMNPADVVLIASNSGVNGSIVGFALRARELGHPVIAVTSLEHTRAVEPKHPSGLRLSEIADLVIDNLAPYGDTTLDANVGGVGIGAVSSITAAFIAQLLTMGVAERIAARGETPPIYLSANIPEGDAHNSVLEERYAPLLGRAGNTTHPTQKGRTSHGT
ncbi:MAG: SIS domain-containing protein [Micrococcales bacterium]|nr:SIS domain-containing protein [Micrococcales bacterium]